jgi:hypothetical protein
VKTSRAIKIRAKFVGPSVTSKARIGGVLNAVANYLPRAQFPAESRIGDSWTGDF